MLSSSPASVVCIVNPWYCTTTVRPLAWPLLGEKIGRKDRQQRRIEDIVGNEDNIG